MAVQLKPHSRVSRVPAILLGASVAVFAFYFLFLRGGRPQTAEASQPPPREQSAAAPAPPAAAPVEMPEAVVPPTLPRAEAARPAPPPKAEWQQDVAIERL